MKEARQLWFCAEFDSEKFPLLQKTLEELGVRYFFYSDLVYPFVPSHKCRELAYLISKLHEDVESAQTEVKRWRNEAKHYHEATKELKEIILHLMSDPYLYRNNPNNPIEGIIKSREKVSKDAVLAKVLKADTLLVLDKYLLDAGKMKEEEYAKELSQWLDFREGKKVKLVVSVQGKKRQCVLKLLVDEAKSKGTVIEIADGSKYEWQHDRFWIDENSKEAFLIGTSINGLWKHLSVILPLNSEDTEILLRFINNHARFEFKRAEQFITDCNSPFKQPGH